MSSVYFIEAQYKRMPVKIGYAADVATRLAQVQVGCPEQLSLLYAVECGTRAEEFEQRLHEAFAHLRIRRNGEWFESSPEIFDVIRRLQNASRNEAGELDIELFEVRLRRAVPDVRSISVLEPVRVDDPERALDTRQTALLLGIANITLQQMRARGSGPRFFKVGRRAVRYRLGDVLDYRTKRSIQAAP